MIFRLFSQVTNTSFLFSCILLCFSCRNSNDGISYIFENGKYEYGPDKELLASYLSSDDISSPNENEFDQKVTIYVDRSSGISEAFNSDGGLALTQFNTILNYYDENHSIYKSVLSKIEPFNLGGSNATNYFKNDSNYDPIAKAKLRKAFAEITKNNALSFLISDCEEFDDSVNEEEILNGAWAKDYFIDWLNKGNSVHFWITDFETKDGIKKHLYFIAFVPRNVKSEDQKKFNELINDLNKKNPTHLELSNKNWTVVDPGWSESNTGLNTELIESYVKDTYVRGFENEPVAFEFISGTFSLQEMSKIPSLKNYFYKGIKVDLSKNQFFNINQIEIDVAEVSEDLSKFAVFEQLSKVKPDFIVDEESKKKILNPDDPNSQYFDESGKLKSEFLYSKSGPIKLKEIFAFDSEEFKSSSKESRQSSCIFSIKLHPNFNPENPTLKNIEKEELLLRIDFKVNGFNSKTPDLSMFQWNSALIKNQGQVNDGLKSSIEQTIVAAKPEGKTIFSLFITIKK